MLGLRTNIPAWGATVMNVEPELYFNDKFSFALPLYWCPWFITESKALRVFASQPELRFRLSPSPFGHHFGLHGSLAWYNLKFGHYRYQDVKRPLLGGGVSYGYSLSIAPNWSLDFSLGVGCASLCYDRFYNTPNGAKADTRKTFYWGIDQISISIGYILDI